MRQRPTNFCSSSGYRAPCTVILEAAKSSSRRSSGESTTLTAAMFSSSRCSFVLPGIGKIQSFCAFGKQIHQSLIRFSVLRREARDDVAEVIFVELRIVTDFTG